MTGAGVAGYGLCGVAPTVLKAFSTPTNHTNATTLDETGATLVQLANFVGTLAIELKAKGVIG